MKLIVGLGNPGLKYEKTRHNVGFMALDKIASYLNVPINREKMNGLYGEAIYNGEKIILLKPQLYMNLSGDVVRQFLKFYKISIVDLLILSDDLDIPLGRIKLKYKGSSGGHNGLKNIELNLGTREYKRLKIGISNNKQVDTCDYVLGSFQYDEWLLLEETLGKIPFIFQDYLEIPFDCVMSKYNR